MIEIIVGIVLILLAFPVGALLAKWTEEELKSGRKWFISLIIVSLIGMAFSFFLVNPSIKFSVILSLLFIMIVSFVSLSKK